jgi:hypothetical protein
VRKISEGWTLFKLTELFVNFETFKIFQKLLFCPSLEKGKFSANILNAFLSLTLPHHRHPINYKRKQLRTPAPRDQTLIKTLEDEDAI